MLTTRSAGFEERYRELDVLIQLESRFARVDNVQARYVRVVAKNIGTIPDWHPGAGGKAWIFADEIIVE